ncbi:MAG TPA: MFS transporter [Trebonia sp.]|jgi:EmrB/QacA subfamily drug resistance transporter
MLSMNHYRILERDGQVETRRTRNPGRVAGTPLLIVLAMAQFMVVLDFTIVNVALPSIQASLHIGTSTLQWLISGYAISFGGFLLLGGRLSDLFGQARMFRIGLVVFVVASVAGGLAVEPVLLVTSRVVQGIGAAIVAPAGLSLLVTSWPEEHARSHALGVYGAVVSTGFASGAVLGGLLVQESWRLVFFVNAPIGVLLLACYWLLPPSAARQGGLDLPGAVTGTVGVALIVLAVARAGDTLQVAEPLVLALAAVLLLAGFVLRERRAPVPLLDLTLFADRGIRAANLCLLAVGAYNAGQILLVTLYLQQGRHLSSVLTGLCFVPQAAGAFALAGPASNIVPRLGPRRSLTIAMLLALVSLYGSAAAVACGSVAALLASLFLMGVSARINMMAATLAGTRGKVAAREQGTASALLTASRQCGSAIGVAVLAAVLVVASGSDARRTAIGLVVAACFALAGLASARLAPPATRVANGKQPAEHRFLHRAGGVP